MNKGIIKLNARLSIRQSKPSPLLFAAIFLALSVIIGTLEGQLSGIQMSGDEFNSIVDMEAYEEYMETGDQEALTEYLNTFYGGLIDHLNSIKITPLALGLYAALIILNVLINAGMYIFSLNTVRKTEPSLWNLLDGFGMFFRVLWLYILEAVYIFLWSLLCIVPGLIAMYRYRQAIYILIDHPEMSASQCISESKRMMGGYKIDLFWLDFSFLGWMLFVVVLNMMDTGMSVLNFIGIGTLLNVWVLPYRQLSYAEYYVKLRALPAEGEFPQAEFNGQGF